MINERIRIRASVAAALLALLGTGLATPAGAQVIEGTLMEVDSDRPISLGLVIMMTEQGDSITSAVTDGQDQFHLESGEPGSFVLVASAFGFKETSAGVFELGPGGSMTVQFRVGVEAMPIDGIIVGLQRPAIEHQLVSQGFVRRLQRGLGHFITPYDIENAPATRTADLFRGIPGVAVRTIGGGLFAFTGENIQFLDANGYCTPTVFIDGVRISPMIVASQSMDNLLPLQDVDAVEIYRRPAEVPIEYSSTAIQPTGEADCGVLVAWTRRR